MFTIDLTTRCIRANGHTVPIVLVGKDKQPWFHANEAATLLGYVNFKKAVTTHVKAHRMKTLEALIELDPSLGTALQPNGNEMRARYCNESGLYQLTL